MNGAPMVNPEKKGPTKRRQCADWEPDEKERNSHYVPLKKPVSICRSSPNEHLQQKP